MSNDNNLFIFWLKHLRMLATHVKIKLLINIIESEFGSVFFVLSEKMEKITWAITLGG